MLQVPAKAVIGDVTVFSDDTQYNLFYLVPSTPGVRLDASGNPVFLLVMYEFSADDRAANPKLPVGGGYMNFDTALDIDAATQDRIRAALQPDVNTEWHRRSTGTPAEQASIAGTTAPPAVQFDTPTFTRGKVAVDAPQATALISARVSEGEPSLLSGSTAIFNLDLTEAGATFMRDTLLGPGGSGATDLTPIQVAYDIYFWAQLPPVGINISADSQKIHDYIHKQLIGRGVDNCTTYDFAHTDLTSDSVTASGAITVQIDQGSASLPDSALADLRNYAFDLLKSMVTTSFFTTQTPGAASPDGTARGDKSGKSYYLKDYDATTMSLNVHLEQRSVVEWHAAPQATLTSFFQGQSAATMTQYVRKISLDDPFWQTLTIPVRVFADWSGPVSWVRVDLEYDPPGTDPKSASFTFDADHTQTQVWTQNIVGGDVSFRYRTAVAFKDFDPQAPSDWTTTNLPAVNIEASAPTIAATVVSGDIDFTTVSQVQVTLAYEDPDQGVGRQEQTVVLTATNTSGSYKRVIYKPITKKMQYKMRFTMTSGDVQDDGVWHVLDGAQLVVNQDRSAVLRVSLLPTGDGWADVMRVMVDLRYSDPNDNYSVETTIDLESLDQFKTWSVPLQDKTLRGYDYRMSASFKNGAFNQTDWQSVTDGSEILPLPLHRPGINVLLLADTIDFKSTPLVELTCSYTSTDPPIAETFVFRDTKPQTWSINVPDGSPVDYTWQATYSLTGADPVTTDPVEETDTVVIIPAYRVAGAGKMSVMILGNLVDYTATPMVGVDLTYDDDANNVHETGSYVLTKADPTASWVIDQKNTAVTQYGFTLTYYTPDGNPHAGAPRHDTRPRVVVPKFTA